MKPEEQLTIRYDDPLTATSDDALDKLAQELDTAYTAPERPAGLSWATASQRLALIPQHTLNAETRPGIRPLRLAAKQGRKKALLAVAAIVVLTLLSAALLSTTGASWFRQSQHAQPPPSLSTPKHLLLPQLFPTSLPPHTIHHLPLTYHLLI